MDRQNHPRWNRIPIWLAWLGLFLLLVSCPVAAAAQDTSPDTACDIYYYGKFRPGSVTTTVVDFGQTVNLRAGPSIDSPVVAQLNRFTPVAIVAATDRKLERDGYADFWYDVTELDFGIYKARWPIRGYIWGGLLAKFYLRAFRKQQLNPFTVVGWLEGRSGGEKRLVIESFIAGYSDARVELQPIGAGIDGGATYNYSLRGELLEVVPGFEPPLTLVKLTFEYGACDYPNGDVWLVQSDSGAMVEAFRAVGAGNEFGSLWFEYLFPSDTGGEANRIVVRWTRTTAVDEEHPEIRESKTWDEVYLWDGQRLALHSDTAARSD